ALPRRRQTSLSRPWSAWRGGRMARGASTRGCGRRRRTPSVASSGTLGRSWKSTRLCAQGASSCPTCGRSQNCQDCSSGDETLPGLILRIAEQVGRLLGLPPYDLLGPARPSLDAASALVGVRFKLAARADEQRLRAYTIYAHGLAHIALRAACALPCRLIP